MSGRTALELAFRLDGVLRWPILTEAADMLREQHAEIERLTAELEACADSCESEADKSVGWAKVRMIEMANRMRRTVAVSVGARAKP